MSNHSGKFSICLENLEKFSGHHNLASGVAPHIDALIFHNHHLPVEPIEMPRRWMCSPCAPQLPPQNIHNRGSIATIEHDGVMALDDEMAVNGADKFPGDVVGADTIRVVRVKYNGSVLLLAVRKAGLAVFALLLRRAENKVGAVGAGHGLKVSIVIRNHCTADADERHRCQCHIDLPWVIVPPRVPMGEVGHWSRLEGAEGVLKEESPDGVPKVWWCRQGYSMPEKESSHGAQDIWHREAV